VRFTGSDAFNHSRDMSDNSYAEGWEVIVALRQDMTRGQINQCSRSCGLWLADITAILY